MYRRPSACCASWAPACVRFLFFIGVAGTPEACSLAGPVGCEAAAVDRPGICVVDGSRASTEANGRTARPIVKPSCQAVKCLGLSGCQMSRALHA